MKTTKLNNKPAIFNYSNQDIFKASIETVNAKENGSTVFIPHVCNNVNVFSAGFADAVAQYFPIVKENFHLLTKPSLGQNQNISVLNNKQYGHELIIVNMIAQNGVYSNKNIRPLNYGALAFCMTELRNFARNIRKNKDFANVEIHAPKFGSGLAGGDWRFISEMINDIWIGFNIFVHIPK